ncbi:MAG: class I SAM-dependent methyltransferase [Salinibacter sp.]
MGSRRVLSRREAKAVYDRIGAWQDTQAFYEAPALDELVAHGTFDEARTVFEVGCGTGRLAERLLRERCPSDARYEGVDLSATMVETARERLASFGARATVRQTDGALTFGQAAGSQDRVVATYLLDLLSREDACTLLRESHRLLAPDGRLCLAGLTWGRGPVSGGISALWDALHALRPEWVGGCRPLRTRSLVDATQWHERHHAVVTGWGVPSEVLVLTPA